MTSPFPRLLTLTAFAKLSSSGLRSLSGSSISKKAQLLPFAVFGVCALLLQGAVCVPAHAQTNWIQEFPANRPLKRDSHAMAYDAAYGNVVLFGGYNDAITDLNDTWVWDGTNWTRESPANRPPARYLHAMTYDAAHGKVVLFGGYSYGNLLNDTWVWDGANWTQKIPANSPSARCCFAMAQDAAHGKVVLFGGYNPFVGGDLNDTWVWDGTNWTQKIPAVSPSARANFAMAYDAARGNVVLFGDGDDTWVWDGANWTQESPVTSPSARTELAMAYAGYGDLVLFGGCCENSNLLNDTWAWNGTNWTQDSPATSPSARIHHAMAHVARPDNVVLFGGNNGNQLNDTWVWRQSNKSQSHQ